MQNLKKNLYFLSKSFITGLTVWTIFVAGLTLCCEVGLIYANEHISKTSSCCHGAAEDQLKEGKDKTCKCCFLTRNIPDQIKQPIEIAKSISEYCHKSFNSLVSYFRYQNQITLLVLVNQGPPRAPNVPIYLRLSVLRL